MMQHEADFLIKAYELLFERNAEAQRHRWNFVQGSIVGIFAFYAYLADKNEVSARYPWLLWLPVGVSLLGLFQHWGLRKGMKERGNVMAFIEGTMNFDGWEKVRSQMKGPDFVKSPLSSIAYAYWISMIVLSTTIARTFG